MRLLLERLRCFTRFLSSLQLSVGAGRVAGGHEQSHRRLHQEEDLVRIWKTFRRGTHPLPV